MEIKVCENLKILAQSFSKYEKPLYIVGGYVRNCLLGVSGDTDIDISGALNIETVLNICSELGFRAQVVNKSLGTVLITTDKGEQFEYTQFRVESYGEGGEHNPNTVVFVDDIKTDASRRDFTINALYYDILNDKIVDFYNGVRDIEKKVLKTCKSPSETFKDDGLRILRLVRFVCELGFKPNKQTFDGAINACHNVKAISRERVLKELKLTVNGSLKYKHQSINHKLIAKYYNKLNVWQYVFNSNFNNFKVATSGKMFNAFVKSDGENRYLAFMCMILNNYLKGLSTDANLISLVNTLLGSDGLKDSAKNMQEVLDTYRFAQRILYEKPESYSDNRSCITFENLGFEAKKYLLLINQNKVNDIKLNILQMKKRKVPFNVSEINISNEDLITKLRIDNKNVSLIKQKLFEMCVDGIIINDRQILLEQAKFLNESLRNNKK